MQVIMSQSGVGVEKVVVIQSYIDVISWSEMNWLVDAMPDLNPGDEVVLLGLLHHIINPPSTLSLHAAAKLFGYKGKEEHNMIIGSTKKVEEVLHRRISELQKNHGVMQLQNLFEVEKKVKLRVEVEAGSSAKVAAIRGAKRLGATWIILDREMQKEKKYFTERLSCKISSMKSNNTIVLVRDPIIDEHAPDDDVTYDEMIPSYSWEDLSPLTSHHKSPGAQGTFSSREMVQYSCGRPILMDNPKQVFSASTSSVMDILEHSPPKDEFPSRDLSTCSNYNGTKNVKTCVRTDKSQSSMEVYFENSVCSVCKNRRPKINWQLREFGYSEIHEATKGFSQKNYLSEGGFGFVFRGKLKHGPKIAVKQHKAVSLQGEKEFRSEVVVLSQARHQNLVMLLGSCTQGTHRLLVYEYVCNGSLEQHLSDDVIVPLTWEKRVKISVGAAEGLRYLHARNIIHRDMRPSNILITHDHESLLGDFGLAKDQQDNTQSLENGVVGTLGYVAPEYAESGKMSTKTDVYSFGVVLLQLITGLRTTDKIPEGKSLIGWAKPLLQTKNYPDLIDKRIAESHDFHQLFWMVTTAEQCLKKDPNKRCTMEQVVHCLSFIKEGKTNFIRLSA